MTLGDAANDSGVLQLGNGAACNLTLAGLSVSGNGDGNRVADGGTGMATLTLNVSGTDAFGGILGGSGNQNNLALVMDGTGKLILNGASTYTGGTTVSAASSRYRLDHLGGFRQQWGDALGYRRSRPGDGQRHRLARCRRRGALAFRAA